MIVQFYNIHTLDIFEESLDDTNRIVMKYKDCDDFKILNNNNGEYYVDFRGETLTNILKYNSFIEAHKLDEFYNEKMAYLSKIYLPEFNKVEYVLQKYSLFDATEKRL